MSSRCQVVCCCSASVLHEFEHPGLLRACNDVPLQGARLLEDVARWGAENMFSTAVGAEDTAASQPMNSLPKSCGSFSEKLSQDALSALVAIADGTRKESGMRALEAKDTAATNCNGFAPDAGGAKALQVAPALEGASIREWQPGECRDCEDSGADGGEPLGLGSICLGAAAVLRSYPCRLRFCCFLVSFVSDRSLITSCTCQRPGVIFEPGHACSSLQMNVPDLIDAREVQSFNPLSCRCSTTSSSLAPCYDCSS